MAAPQNFRGALNGFNREDVVHYIEYLNAKHNTEINQLNAELDQLHARLTAALEDTSAKEQLAQALEDNAALETQLAEQEVTIEALKARCTELEEASVMQVTVEDSRNPELEERCEALEKQLQEALADLGQARSDLAAARASHAPCRMEQELEAYRRAERTERVARERAEQVYRQANGALADATVKVDEAFTQIENLADRVSGQLAQLQSAVQGSKQALADAAATLYTIRPDSK